MMEKKAGYGRALHWQGSGHRWLDQARPKTQPIPTPTIQQGPVKAGMRQELRVEGIKVSADRKYMYCHGLAHRQGLRSKSNVVVAVGWLDKDRKALNTEWKRIDTNNDSSPAPLLPDSLSPFIVKTPLDRRVKWVNAYAFSGVY